jgi:hypothetical protein
MPTRPSRGTLERHEGRAGGDRAPPANLLSWRYVPLWAAEGYLLFSVLVFAFGPWPWPVESPVKLYVFLGAAHLALAVGYLAGARRGGKAYIGRTGPGRLVALSAAVTLLLLVPTSLNRTGAVVPDVVGGLVNPGVAYGISQQVRGSFVMGEWLRILAAPLLTLLIPLTVFFWARLSRWRRVSAVTAVLGMVAIFVSMGTNKLLADLAIVIPVAALAVYVRRRGGLSAPVLRRGRMRRLASIALIGIALLVTLSVFFTRGQETRASSGALYGYERYSQTAVDRSNAILQVVPEGMHAFVIGMSTYMGQGYYGLSLALEQEFVPCYGAGHSLFLFTNVSEIPGLGWVAECPYPVRAQSEGWNAFSRWSSFYPWAASDVTFPGSILVVALIGYLFAVTWADVVGEGNPIAVALLALVTIMVVYLPANNQVLQDGEGFVAFWVLLFWWRRTRARRRFRHA